MNKYVFIDIFRYKEHEVSQNNECVSSGSIAG
jgi:hypothetical protein